MPERLTPLGAAINGDRLDVLRLSVVSSIAGMLRADVTPASGAVPRVGDTLTVTVGDRVACEAPVWRVDELPMGRVLARAECAESRALRGVLDDDAPAWSRAAPVEASEALAAAMDGMRVSTTVRSRLPRMSLPSAPRSWRFRAVARALEPLVGPVAVRIEPAGGAAVSLQAVAIADVDAPPPLSRDARRIEMSAAPLAAWDRVHGGVARRVLSFVSDGLHRTVIWHE